MGLEHFPVIFTLRKDDLRSIAAQANLLGSSQSYGIKPILWDQEWPNGRRPPSCPNKPPSCPNKIGAGWPNPTD